MQVNSAVPSPILSTNALTSDNVKLIPFNTPDASSFASVMQSLQTAPKTIVSTGSSVLPSAYTAAALMSGGPAGGLNAAGQGTTLAMPVPASAPVTQPFGPTAYAAEPAYSGYAHFHTGIDFGVPAGTPVDSASGGRVVEAGWDSTGFGNRVIIDHGNGVETLYGHLQSIGVTAGDTVQSGQQLGQSGSTGNSSGPHLHFGVEVNGQWVDPATYLGGSSTTASPSQSSGTLGIGGGATGMSSSLTTMIQQAAQTAGVPASLVSAVVQAESGGNTQAVSSAGAKGLMQLMDPTATHYGVTNSFDPAQNLSAGTSYLRDLLAKYNGNQQLAVAAYNAGPAAVDSYGGVPPYAETQTYVQRVMGYQQQYAATNQ